VRFDTSAIILGVVLGALIGRWWVILLAVPFGVFAAITIDIEGLSDTEIAALTIFAVAVSLAAGVILRKGIGWLSR
jgi:hypothetical protein